MTEVSNPKSIPLETAENLCNRIGSLATAIERVADNEIVNNDGSGEVHLIGNAASTIRLLADHLIGNDKYGRAEMVFRFPKMEGES